MANRRSVPLLLQTLTSSGALIQSRRHHGGLGVPPQRRRSFFDGVQDEFGFMAEPRNVIGVFDILKKLLWYLFIGVILLVSSLCFYAGTFQG